MKKREWKKPSDKSDFYLFFLDKTTMGQEWGTQKENRTRGTT